MPESRTEPILKVLIEKIYEKNKAVYLLNSELYIEYNHYIVSSSFSELSSRHLFRLYRFDALNDLDIEARTSGTIRTHR